MNVIEEAGLHRKILAIEMNEKIEEII